MRHGLYMGKRAWPDDKLRGRIPIAAFDRIARRTDRQRVRPGDKGFREAANSAHLLDNSLRLGILSGLQIGVHQIIHGVQLVMRFIAGLGSARRYGVGVDRLFPISDARENMRWHVLRMWRCRGNLRIPFSGIEALFGQGRRVVKMDEVMSDTRMMRLALENRLENAGALELHCIGLVARRSRNVERDRIKDLRFIVTWIGL